MSLRHEIAKNTIFSQTIIYANYEYSQYLSLFLVFGVCFGHGLVSRSSLAPLEFSRCHDLGSEVMRPTDNTMLFIIYDSVIH